MREILSDTISVPAKSLVVSQYVERIGINCPDGSLKSVEFVQGQCVIDNGARVPTSKRYVGTLQMIVSGSESVSFVATNDGTRKTIALSDVLDALEQLYVERATLIPSPI